MGPVGVSFVRALMIPRLNRKPKVGLVQAIRLSRAVDEDLISFAALKAGTPSNDAFMKVMEGDGMVTGLGDGEWLKRLEAFFQTDLGKAILAALEQLLLGLLA